MRAFTLALGMLTDRRVAMLWLRSMGLTLAAFLLIGWLGWLALSHAMALWLDDAGEITALLMLALLVIGGWLLFRILAIAVLQFYADDVVALVEQRHYPAMHDRAQPLGWKQELAQGARGALRAVGYNLLALPVALLSLPTGIGPAIVFGFVNALLIGRELSDMVRLRHQHGGADAAGDMQAALPGMQRLMLGTIVVLLLSIPFANLFAPFLGAAMATHLAHKPAIAPVPQP